MFGGDKVKLDKDLLARLKKVSDTAGYATVEEFITHVLEKELPSAAFLARALPPSRRAVGPPPSVS